MQARQVSHRSGDVPPAYLQRDDAEVTDTADRQTPGDAAVGPDTPPSSDQRDWSFRERCFVPWSQLSLAAWYALAGVLIIVVAFVGVFAAAFVGAVVGEITGNDHMADDFATVGVAGGALGGWYLAYAGARSGKNLAARRAEAARSTHPREVRPKVEREVSDFRRYVAPWLVVFPVLAVVVILNTDAPKHPEELAWLGVAAALTASVGLLVESRRHEELERYLATDTSKGAIMFFLTPLPWLALRGQMLLLGVFIGLAITIIGHQVVAHRHRVRRASSVATAERLMGGLDLPTIGRGGCG